VQVFALDHELKLAFSDRGRVIGFFRHPIAAIPELDRATLRNSPFEVAVVERMIFDLDGEALIMQIDRRTLGDGPGFQYAVKFETEIVVQARGGVFLDYRSAGPLTAR